VELVEAGAVGFTRYRTCNQNHKSDQFHYGAGLTHARCMGLNINGIHPYFRAVLEREFNSVEITFACDVMHPRKPAAVNEPLTQLSLNYPGLCVQASGF
jgi:hypothetical protein